MPLSPSKIYYKKISKHINYYTSTSITHFLNGCFHLDSRPQNYTVLIVDTLHPSIALNQILYNTFESWHYIS